MLLLLFRSTLFLSLFGLDNGANHREHHLLNRGAIINFLRALDAGLQQRNQAEIDTLQPVAAISQSAWLWEQIEQSREELFLYAGYCTLQTPTAEGMTWLDLLQQLLQRGVKVHLLLNELPNLKVVATGRDGESENAAIIMLTTHLRLLLRKGLKLQQSNRQLPWVAIIDPLAPTASAVHNHENAPIALDQAVSQQLFVTTNHSAIAQSWQSAQQIGGRMIEYGELAEPKETIVVEVKNDGRKRNEEDYFSSFYTDPVVGMVITDRYLDDYERIANRLGAHIQLAYQAGRLEWVNVKTEHRDTVQDEAIQKLKARFPTVKIQFERDSFVPHDRTINVIRANGTKSRAILGMGLDFIRSNGYPKECFLVFQNIHKS